MHIHAGHHGDRKWAAFLTPWISNEGGFGGQTQVGAEHRSAPTERVLNTKSPCVLAVGASEHPHNVLLAENGNNHNNHNLTLFTLLLLIYSEYDLFNSTGLLSINNILTHTMLQ